MAVKIALLLAVLPAGTAAAQAPVLPVPPAGLKLPDPPRPSILPPLPRAEIVATINQDDKKDEKKDDKKDEKKDDKYPKQKLTEEEFKQYTKLETRERIFSIPDDATLERYVRMKILEDQPKADEKDLKFPPVPDVGGGKPYVAKTANYPPMRVEYSALYVVHRRLHFEDKNAERYGWDLGIVQPFFSAVNFYKDVFLWPQSLASGCAYGFWDTNAGKCLPGSPTPYMLYPPGLTITGGVVEGVIITGAAFAIP
jgi:hypothetical protein